MPLLQAQIAEASYRYILRTTMCKMNKQTSSLAQIPYILSIDAPIPHADPHISYLCNHQGEGLILQLLEVCYMVPNLQL